jgi:hypothetical protein
MFMIFFAMNCCMARHNEMGLMMGRSLSPEGKDLLFITLLGRLLNMKDKDLDSWKLVLVEIL